MRQWERSSGRRVECDEEELDSPLPRRAHLATAFQPRTAPARRVPILLGGDRASHHRLRTPARSPPYVPSSLANPMSLKGDRNLDGGRADVRQGGGCFLGCLAARSSAPPPWETQLPPATCAGSPPERRPPEAVSRQAA